MREFKWSERELLLPADAVLEWEISEGEDFIPTEQYRSSGMNCKRIWNEKKSYVTNFEMKVWVTHANLREPLEIERIVAFESDEEVPADLKSILEDLRDLIKAVIIDIFKHGELLDDKSIQAKAQELLDTTQDKRTVGIYSSTYVHASCD